MDRWLKFFTERFPLVNAAALVAGISLSGIYLSERIFLFLPFIFSFIGIVFILALLRLMEDMRNFDKDLVTRSHHPLPKVLITKHEAKLVIKAMQWILFAYGLLLCPLLGITASIIYIFIAAYFWLINKEFGIKQWISSHSMIYGVFKWLIILLIAIYSVAVMQPESIFNARVWSFALLLFGAFFCNDICSKLNPNDHPVLSTYIHHYGFRFVYNFAVIALALSAMGAIYLGLAPFLIPVEFIVLASLSVVFFQPMLFRMPQIMSSLSLMLHAWGLVIYQASHS
jgi:hypothetical protein